MIEAAASVSGGADRRRPLHAEVRFAHRAHALSFVAAIPNPPAPGGRRAASRGVGCRMRDSRDLKRLARTIGVHGGLCPIHGRRDAGSLHAWVELSAFDPQCTPDRDDARQPALRHAAAIPCRRYALDVEVATARRNRRGEVHAHARRAELPRPNGSWQRPVRHAWGTGCRHAVPDIRACLRSVLRHQGHQVTVNAPSVAPPRTARPTRRRATAPLPVNDQGGTVRPPRIWSNSYVGRDAPISVP